MSEMSPTSAIATPITTEVPQPRDRIFLPQTTGERFKAGIWSAVRLFLFRASPPAFNRWRILLLRLFGAKVDYSAIILSSAYINFPWNLTIGPRVYIGESVILNCMGAVKIGEGTRLSQHAHVCAGTHDYQRRDMVIVRSPITIGKDVWIAADAFVGPGVTVGDGCVLAARSSAFHDLPAGQVCLGEPARARHARFDEHAHDSQQTAAKSGV